MSVPAGPTTTIVVIGVSGSGKSSVAAELVRRLGWAFLEGDDLHPPENVRRLAAGVALRDDDRWPWLRAVAGWVGDQEEAGLDAVVTCSALKRRYRDLLRDGHPSVAFCQLAVDHDELARRLAGRTGHFMAPSLLGSQLADLEPLQGDEPGVVLVERGGPADVAAEAMAALGLEPVVG